MRTESFRPPLRDLMKSQLAGYKVCAERIVESCDGRRLFTTDTGHIGLAPDGMAIGNPVYVLKGASVLVIFSDVEGTHDGESRLVRLTAECYGHWINNLDLWKDKRRVENLIVI